MRKYCLALLGVFMLCGCNTDIDSGKLMTLEIPGNATTGYTWNCKSLDENIASVSEEEYKLDNDDTELVGVGGTYLFIFKGENSGETQISCIYKRSFEEENLYDIYYDVKVDDKKNITVTNITGNYDDKEFPVPKFK